MCASNYDGFPSSFPRSRQHAPGSLAGAVLSVPHLVIPFFPSLQELKLTITCMSWQSSGKSEVTLKCEPRSALYQEVAAVHKQEQIYWHELASYCVYFNIMQLLSPLWDMIEMLVPFIPKRYKITFLRTT